MADQISDAVLDELLRQDPDSKVACETLVTTGLAVVSGEIKTNGYVDVQQVARRVINRIGYTKSDYMFDGDACGVLSSLHEQSPDINQGVVREKAEEQGAGDQGMMFGYACRETTDYMPLSLVLSHMLLQDLACIRREGKQMTYLRPDSKSQVTIEYGDDNKPFRVHTIVVSTQHDSFDEDEKMLKCIKEDVQNVLIPRTMKRLSPEVQALFSSDYKLLVNPTGKFVIGGPHGDTGLTGRKIIVDTYGGKGAHGGGAFSGKDASKVDRSAAYASRHIAKNIVAAGVCDEILVQVAYAIGVADPVSIFVNTYGTAHVKISDAEIAAKISEIFDMRPAAIIKRLKLKHPIYEQTAAYGHFGRDYKEGVETIMRNGKSEQINVEYFTWEKLDYINKIQVAFDLAQGTDDLIKVDSNMKDAVN